MNPAFDDLNIDLIRGEGMNRLEFGAIEAGRKWEETNVIGILHGANRLQVLTVDHPKGYITRINRNNVQEVAGRLSNAKPLAFVLKEVLYVRHIEIEFYSSNCVLFVEFSPTRLEVGLRYLRTYLWQRFGSDVTSSPFQILLKATLSTSTKNGIDSKNKNSIIKPTNLFSPPPSKLLLTKKCAKRTFDDDETCNKGTCSCSEEKEIGKDNADKSYNNNDDDIIANNSCSNYSYSSTEDGCDDDDNFVDEDGYIEDVEDDDEEEDDDDEEDDDEEDDEEDENDDDEEDEDEYDTFIDQSRRIDSTDSEEEEILPIITKRENAKHTNER
ncbi:4677_t:CDS:2 [Entrophospora sp. SA101]|nr:4677_t:CDS:2 [Entrophospora sp. SA101]CAJ0908594.1 7225_t:CDS:2 [Entrophospora sp. SA101]